MEGEKKARKDFGEKQAARHAARMRRRVRAEARKEAVMKIGKLQGKTVPLREVQEAAVLKDRRIWIDDQIAGKWYEDHMLDYVRENGNKLCVVEDDTETTIRVWLATTEEEQTVKKFHEVMDALEKLGYDTEKKEVVTRPVAEGDKDRVVVKVDGEQFGIYDFVKHTFID